MVYSPPSMSPTGPKFTAWDACYRRKVITFSKPSIQAAYSHSQSSHPQYHSAQACIFGFMAMVSSLRHLDPFYDAFELPTIPREVYIVHASAAIPAFIQGPLNLDDLQTSIILVRQGHGSILNVPCAQLTNSTYDIGMHLCPRRRGTKSHSPYVHCFASFVSNWSSDRICLLLSKIAKMVAILPPNSVQWISHKRRKRTTRAGERTG